MCRVANYVHTSIHFCLVVCTKILTLSATWWIYSDQQCPHFRRLTDNHPKCQSCIFGVGKTGCSRNNTCDFCVAWTDDMWDIEEESRERSAKRRKSRSKKKASVSSIVEMLGGALHSAHDVESTTVSSQPLSPAHSRTNGVSGRERSPCERSPGNGTGRKLARSPESPRHRPDGSGERRAKVGLSDERRHSPRPSPSGLESSHRDRSPLGQTNGRHEAGMESTSSPRARDLGGFPPADSPLGYDDSGLQEDPLSYASYAECAKGFSGTDGPYPDEGEDNMSSRHPSQDTQTAPAGESARDLQSFSAGRSAQKTVADGASRDTSCQKPAVSFVRVEDSLPNNDRTRQDEERPVAQPHVESNHSGQEGQGLALPAFESVLTARSGMTEVEALSRQGTALQPGTIYVETEGRCYYGDPHSTNWEVPPVFPATLPQVPVPSVRPAASVEAPDQQAMDSRFTMKELWTWCVCVRASCSGHSNQWRLFPLRGLRLQRRRPRRPPPLFHILLHCQNPVIPEGNLGIGGESIGIDAQGRAGPPMTLSQARRVPQLLCQIYDPWLA